MDYILKFCAEHHMLIIIASFALIIVLTFVCIVLNTKRKNLKENISILYQDCKKLKDACQRSNAIYNNLYQQHTLLMQQYAQSRAKQVESVLQTKKTAIIADAPSHQSPHKYKYLRTATNRRFQKSYDSDEKCFFRIWESAGCFYYEFHGNQEKAIQNFDAVLGSTCEYTGSINNAQKIENIEPGELNADLTITKQAKIKFIS